MSKLQYIGLRYIFEYEITHSKAPYVELLKNAMDKLLDAKLTREEFKNYQAKFLYEATAPQNKFRKKPFQVLHMQLLLVQQLVLAYWALVYLQSVQSAPLSE